MTSRAFRILFTSGPVLCLQHLVLDLSSLVCVRRRHLAQETASSSIAPDFAENIKTGKNRCQKHRQVLCATNVVCEFKDLALQKQEQTSLIMKPQDCGNILFVDTLHTCTVRTFTCVALCVAM